MTERLYVMTFVAVLALAALTQAQTFTTLYNFTGGADGGNPYAGVIQDPAGNLYGTTEGGGDLNCYAPLGCGVVCEVNGSGTETVLHTFTGYPSDGAHPYAPLVLGKAGDLYGATSDGGSSDCGPGIGCGTVFKIDTAGNETLLYSFTVGSDGCAPYQGLVVGNSGTLFGTAAGCGSSAYGTVFKVSSRGEFILLHSFAGAPSDGATPAYGHLIMDESGNLYGVTVSGGSSRECGAEGCGVLYRLSKSGTLTVLHSFGGGTSDGCNPSGSVAQDNAGNLYGTTAYCGSTGNGTLWKVSKKGKETILYNFAEFSSGGCNPNGVVQDDAGNLYGTALYCGSNGYGTIWKVGKKGRLTLLHSFDASDGAYPYSEVLRTARGTLFGTTSNGGTYDGGTVWSYVP